MYKNSSLLLSLGLLYSTTALASANVIARETIEVSNWAGLKAALENKDNSGKTIVLTGDIVVTGSMLENPVGDIILDGQGHKITQDSSYSFLRNSSDLSHVSFKNVRFEGFGASKVKSGGAIYNRGSIGEITGSFTGNSTYNSYYAAPAVGGAIANIGAYDSYGGGALRGGVIGSIQADFTGNHADTEGGAAQGGAIYNSGESLTLVNSNFYDNYVETDALKDSKEGMATQGGAIYTVSDLTVRADNGQSIFRGNTVKWKDGQDSSAIFLGMSDKGGFGNLTLDSVKGGLIQFDDKIASLNYVQTLLKQLEQSGATVTEDGEGGYYVDQKGEKIHLKNENGVIYMSAEVSEEPIKKEELEAQLPKFEEMGFTVVQDGDNYIVTGSMEGISIKYELKKQQDGNYSAVIYEVFSVYGGNIFVTGDETSRVVFNNAIENVGKIDVSGTNVDVNKGVGVIARTITHDGGVLNINAGAKAEDSIVNQGGTMNVADSAEAYRTEVNEGGVLNVASGGYAQDTVVNSGGKLSAEMQAKLHNMLAQNGAILDIDKDAYLAGNIIIEANAIMGGSYDYSKIFKDDVVDSGSLTLVGGLNDILNENSLVNTTADKKLNLTAGSYAIGEGAQAVQGWDQLSFKNNATVKLEGDIAMSGAEKKIFLENGSTLDLAGHSPSNYTITGSLNNDGMMTFTHADDEADDVTTIYGNYTAYTNAAMTIDVNPQTNTSDVLKIEGDVKGTTKVVINSLNNAKPSEKILFVEALNDDLDTGAYFNIHRVEGSPFNWNSLYENNRWYIGTDDIISGGNSGYGDGNAGNMEDDPDMEDDAVLPPNFPDVPNGGIDNGGGNAFRKPTVVAEVISYMGLPSAGIEQTRDLTRAVSSKVASSKVYNQQCHGYYDCEYNGQALRNAWASPVYSYSKVDAPYKYEADITGLDAGFDLQADAYNRLGVYVSSRYGNYDFDGKGEDYSSKVGSEIDIDSYILGIYYRYDAGKYWTMSQIFGGYQDVDISTKDGVDSSTDGLVFGGSVEGGLTFSPRKDVAIEPTVRLGYTQINYDKLKDQYGKTADFDDVRNIELEAGVKIEKVFARDRGFGKVYIKPSVIQNIGSGDVNVTGLQTVEGLEDATLGRVEVGSSMSFNDNWSAYLFAAYTFGSDYKNASINAGLNYAF